MGWTYRKSMRVGPFRINVGKSGIGYSVGGGGFRVGVNARGRRYQSFTIPGTGLRYQSSNSPRGGKTGCALLVLAMAVRSCRVFITFSPHRIEKAWPMSLSFVRTLRTLTSERFLIQVNEGKDVAALDVHYLSKQRVAGTLIVLDENLLPEPKVPDLLHEIDERLLPDASIEDGKVHFTVVAGHVLGTFLPHTV